MKKHSPPAPIHCRIRPKNIRIYSLEKRKCIWHTFQTYSIITCNDTIYYLRNWCRVRVCVFAFVVPTSSIHKHTYISTNPELLFRRSRRAHVCVLCWSICMNEPTNGWMNEWIACILNSCGLAIKFYSTRVLFFSFHIHPWFVFITSTYLDFSKFGLCSLCWFLNCFLCCCEFWNFHMKFASEHMCYAHALLAVMLFHLLTWSIVLWKWKWEWNAKSLKMLEEMTFPYAISIVTQMNKNEIEKLHGMIELSSAGNCISIRMSSRKKLDRIN